MSEPQFWSNICLIYQQKLSNVVRFSIKTAVVNWLILSDLPTKTV